MDQATAVIEQEIVTNRRYVEHPVYGRLQLRRPTPALDAAIAEQRRKVYHRDLQDKSILTRKQIANMLAERGIWGVEDDQKMTELMARSGDLIARLTALGYDTIQDLFMEISRVHTQLIEQLEEADEPVLSALGRFFDVDSPVNMTDLTTLRGASTTSTVDDLLERGNNLRIQAEYVKELSQVKSELSEMMTQQATYFGDSIEARAERAQNMAKIFYCVTKDGGQPVWDTFEAMWDEEPENVAWISSQIFYFENGITDDWAEVLYKHGFMERVIATEESSENSPDHPPVKSDGESPSPQPLSSESATPTS